MVAGLALCLAAASIAYIVARTTGAPLMTLCLLIGMGCGIFCPQTKLSAGVEAAAGPALRLGVALMGMQVVGASADFVAGVSAGALVVVACSLVCGLVGARLLNLSPAIGVVTGAAVGVCGVSAAVAVASAIGSREQQRDLPMGAIVVCVSLMSALAMTAWPSAAALLRLSDLQAGVAIGGSVHDVAQATAAGYAVSEEAGAAATIAKMSRVVLLAPLVLVVMLAFGGARANWRTLPWYLPVFIVLAIAANGGWVAEPAREFGALVSRGLLAVALVGLGFRTPWRELAGVSWRLPLLVMAESLAVIFIASGVAISLF